LRFVSLLLIGAVGFALCGCVYLRLLEFKKQLSRFDENFTMPATEDISLRCLHPLLQPDDIRWLGAAPKTAVIRDGSEDWVIRWVKETAPGVKEEAVYDMELDLRFIDGRVAEACVPKRYLAYVSRELFVSMLRSTGTAKVNHGDHQADAQTETPDASVLPNLSTVKAMLGEPTRKEISTTRIIHFYRYRLDSGEPAAKTIEVSFAFEANSGELRKFTARLPRGTLNYNFVPSVPKPDAEKTGS
jgi:hypothetical protein